MRRVSLYVSKIDYGNTHVIYCETNFFSRSHLAMPRNIQAIFYCNYLNMTENVANFFVSGVTSKIGTPLSYCVNLWLLLL